MSLMYISAVTDWATHLIDILGYHDVVQAYTAQLQCQTTNIPAYSGSSSVNTTDTPCTYLSFGLSGSVHALTLCAPTIILAVNVVLGDAVVWWRVWTIWPRSLIVRAAGLILLTATLAMGLLDVNDSCPPSAFEPLLYYNLAQVPPGALFQKNLFGLTASVLSLATNMVATALVWIKAWEHRKFIASVNLGRTSRVERALALLIESGSVYCILWMLVVIYQVMWQIYGDAVSPHTQTVNSAFEYFLQGCLIPLVGMYPTAIILLVALDKSHFRGSTLGRGLDTRGTAMTVSHISFRHATRTSAYGSESESTDALSVARESTAGNEANSKDNVASAQPPLLRWASDDSSVVIMGQAR
ncbi:hypothetical protein C8Q80DRAFT_206216 [Daedaleopsis nitida]|nr:hypothetical protein C8Q80DRAFT_206216 [Daedaleopsis nitida]